VDQQCRITVVGERRQADLAVPTAAPIASYVTTLARVCGQDGNSVLLSAWSLGPAIGAPFAPERSLGELGVLDGSVLYLRDVIEGEFADPVVYDVAERVAEVAERRLHRRWNTRARTVTVLAVGLGWLIAALTALGVRHQIGHAVLAELAVLFGLVLPVIGWWTSAERGWPVPPRLRETVALSAVPLLAVAAWAVSASHRFSGLDGAHGHLTHGALAAAALVTGALAGAIVAYAAVPVPETFTVLLTAVVAAVAGIGLAAARADAIVAATVTAVIAFALLTVAPRLAAWIITFVDRQARARGKTVDRDADPVATAVSAAATVLIAWSGFLAAVLAVTLVPMAASRSTYAAAAAGCLGLGLLLRAGAARLIAEVVPLLVAGAAALLTLLVVGPGNLGWPSWVSPTGLIVIAAVLIVSGFRRLMRSPGLPAAARPGWLGGIGSMLGGGGAVLAIAALGAFSHLVSLGHHL
jgi:ESX secretion system protein EccD